MKHSSFNRLRAVLPTRQLGPQSVESIDYLDLCPPPPTMIEPDGTYASGWYERFDGHISPGLSQAPIETFQRWFHLGFDDPRYYVVVNIADMFKAGNVALLIAHKERKTLHHASVIQPLLRNRIHVDNAHTHFHDPASGSFIRIENAQDTQRIIFSVHARNCHLSGEARTYLDPFVQITGYHPGFGTLQWWGNLILEHATLTFDGHVIPLEPGILGSYDRTLGHRRRRQNWNWISTTGRATRSDTHETVSLALQLARDRELARPHVHAAKYAVWTGDTGLRKLSDLEITYDVLDAQTHTTSPWKIQGGDDTCQLDIEFTPGFQRREKTRLLWLYDVDFNQYYGRAQGHLRIDGVTYTIRDLFTLAEDSRLAL